MTRAHKSVRTLPLVLALALALASIAGLVGMLLMDGIWDWVFFICSALPLLAGGWRWSAARYGASS